MSQINAHLPSQHLPNSREVQLLRSAEAFVPIKDRAITSQRFHSDP